MIAVALRRADKSGLDTLSMRSLAKELGFGVMSLYNHVKDKDDLLDAMVESVAAEIELPKYSPTDQTVDWKAELRGCIISAYRMMLAHPWLPGQ